VILNYFKSASVKYQSQLFRLWVEKYARLKNIERKIVDPKEFDLSLLNDSLKNLGVRYLEGGDIAGIIFTLNQEDRMAFVFDNAPSLLLFGVYEIALFNAYVSCHANLHAWDVKTLKFLFKLCDREVLYRSGGVFCGNYPLIVYRGVCGEGEGYRPRGLSWTNDFEKAKWFAKFPEERFGVKLPNCHVYQVSIAREDVYFYNDDRQESEFVCDIKARHRPKLVWADE